MFFFVFLWSKGLILGSASAILSQVWTITFNETVFFFAGATLQAEAIQTLLGGEQQIVPICRRVAPANFGADWMIKY
jgi:hypothetical protein